MLQVFEQLKENTNQMRKEYIRKKLVQYYNRISKGSVSIPAFILANEDIKIIERDGKINEWYKHLRNANV